MLTAPRRLGWLAEVVDNRVFVVDGPLASSAGITARIALALHLIAQDCGESLTAAVAVDMVVYLRRSARDPTSATTAFKGQLTWREVCPQRRNRIPLVLFSPARINHQATDR